MSKNIFQIAVVLIFSGLLTSGAYAAPVLLSDAQMDTIAAGGVEKVDGFVCPVITTDGVMNSPNGAAIGEGHYTIIGPNVSVPVHATNANGAGVPGDPNVPGEYHSQPGDTDYTAIWGPGN